MFPRLLEINKAVLPLHYSLLFPLTPRRQGPLTTRRGRKTRSQGWNRKCHRHTNSFHSLSRTYHPSSCLISNFMQRHLNLSSPSSLPSVFLYSGFLFIPLSFNSVSTENFLSSRLPWLEIQRRLPAAQMSSWMYFSLDFRSRNLKDGIWETLWLLLHFSLIFSFKEAFPAWIKRVSKTLICFEFSQPKGAQNVILLKEEKIKGVSWTKESFLLKDLQELSSTLHSLKGLKQDFLPKVNCTRKESCLIIRFPLFVHQRVQEKKRRVKRPEKESMGFFFQVYIPLKKSWENRHDIT